VLFVSLSITLAIVSIRANSTGEVDQSLDRSVTPASGQVPAGLEGVLSGQGQANPAAATPAEPAQPQDAAQSGVAE
jgi:hypothetical protein